VISGAAFRAAMEHLGYQTGRQPAEPLSLADRRRLAAERAGTSDPKSTAYKNAMRYYQRAQTTAGQTRGQPGRQFARRVRERGLHVHAELEIDPSPAEDRDQSDMRPRTMNITIPGSELEACAEALERADFEEAADHFANALVSGYTSDGGTFDQYDADDMREIVGEVDALDISWGNE